MSNNLENERSVTSGKMYPIDLAPQKITIVKSVSNTELKMAHLIPGQPKTSASGQMLAHAGPVGLMRPAAQIISPGVASQPQMIVSGSPILQGNQIVSQGSQLISQGTQILSQSQLISSSGQLISPGTQIISQGTQLSAQVSSNNTGTSNVHTNVSTSISGGQVLNVGGQLVSGGGNLVVSSSVRTLPPTSVRVLSPLAHPNTRPAVLSNVNVSTTGGVLVNKSVGMTSHVPRGLAAGASLAVRQVTPSPNASQGSSAHAWSAGNRGPRGALVYGGRTGLPRPSRPSTPGAVPHAAAHAGLVGSPALQPTLASQPPHSAVISLPSTTVLSSNSVITGALRGPSPRLPSPALAAAPLGPRPLPLLQRNYQPKVVGVASVGVRGVVGNSAPTQLYYEVPRCASAPAAPAPAAPAPVPAPAPAVQTAPRLRPPYAHHALQQHQANTVSTVTVLPETRPPHTSAQTTAVVPRPSILRKRDIESSPTKPVTVTPVQLGPVTSISALPLRSPAACFRPVGGSGAGGWEDVPAGGGGGVAGGGGGSGGSTTMSASSSPAPLDEPEPDVSPRKKPRKQMLTNEVRQCEFTPEETPPTPPPVNTNPPPKRPLLSSSYVCGWRGTALHFARPADVRRREPRAKDILAIASQKHVLSAADGWKVHHLTAMMDDLVSLEADVGEQLAGVQRALETASGRVTAALRPHSHTLMELLKGNIQRSKIVCEGIQEAREDILRVFTHRNFVSEILTRQADKRCFRKHRSQS